MPYMGAARRSLTVLAYSTVGHHMGPPVTSAVCELEQVHMRGSIRRTYHPKAIAINAKAAELFAVGRRDDVQRLALQRQHLDAPSLVFANVDTPVTYGDADGLIELPRC